MDMTRKSRAFRLLAVAVAASVIAPGLAIADQTVNQFNVLNGNPYFRGTMAETPEGGTTNDQKGGFAILANGHGSATIEVYDNNNVLLGTVTSPLTAVPDTEPGTIADPVLAVQVTFNRVASGNDACTTLGNTISCDLVVSDPPAGAAYNTDVTVVASLRGTVKVAWIGPDHIYGKGFCEETYRHTLSVFGGEPAPY